MRRIAPVALLIGFSTVSQAAVTVQECVDENGLTYFADRCPPGNTKIGSRKLRTLAPPSLAESEVAEANPVTFYAIPECDACDLVRNQLQKRGIPFEEKNVSSDYDVQEELKGITGGNLTIPTVNVADHTITGYNKQDLDAALTDAGYPVPAATPAN